VTLKLFLQDGNNRQQIREEFDASDSLAIGFNRDIWKYNIQLFLDENLAYAGSYDNSDEKPF